MKQLRTLENLLSDTNFIVVLRYHGGPFVKYSIRDGSLLMERLMFDHYNPPSGKRSFKVVRYKVTPETYDTFDPFSDNLPEEDLLSPEQVIDFKRISPGGYVTLRAHRIQLPVLFLRTLAQSPS